MFQNHRELAPALAQLVHNGSGGKKNGELRRFTTTTITTTTITTTTYYYYYSYYYFYHHYCSCYLVTPPPLLQSTTITYTSHYYFYYHPHYYYYYHRYCYTATTTTTSTTILLLYVPYRVMSYYRLTVHRHHPLVQHFGASGPGVPPHIARAARLSGAGVRGGGRGHGHGAAGLRVGQEVKTLDTYNTNGGPPARPMFGRRTVFFYIQSSNRFNHHLHNKINLQNNL